MAKSDYISLRITPLEKEQVKLLSAYGDQTISDYLRNGLSHYISPAADTKRATYCAYWIESGDTVYNSVPKGKLLELLPLSAWPIKIGNELTDPFDGAEFTVSGTRDKIRIEKE